MIAAFMLDADEQPVTVPTGPDIVGPLRADLKFNLGRPPTLEIGEGQTVSLTINFPGLPMPKVRKHFLRCISGGNRTEAPGLPSAPPDWDDHGLRAKRHANPAIPAMTMSDRASIQNGG